MKKITKIAVLTASLLSLFFASCSNATMDNMTVTGVDRDSMEVTLTVTSDSDLVDFSEPTEVENSESRSILPTAYIASDVWFYLCAKETKDANFSNAPMVVDFKGNPIPPAGGGAGAGSPTPSTKEGTVVINLAQANYDFELYAVKKAPGATTAPTYASKSLVQDAACLKAIAQADLRYGNTVNFFLTSEGLYKSGSISLKLYAQGWDPDDFVGYDVKAACYFTKDTATGNNNYTKGSSLSSTEKTLVDATANNTLKISSSIPKGTAPQSANYTATGVEAGTYLFEITFQKVGDTKTFYWNDDIKVLPDQTTEVSVGITPTIDLPPAKPASFNAAYIDDLNSEYYKLEFTWDASAINNESNFKIDLLTVPSSVKDSDAKNPTTDSEWTTLLGKSTPVGGTPENKEYQNDFVGEENIYSSGSLGKNSEVAVFRAAYGKRYVARICSVNDIGNSEWTYCTIDTDIAADNSKGIVAATGFKSSTINRYKVTYNLSNGTLKDSSDNPVLTVYGCSQIFVTKTNAPANTKTDYWSVSGATTTYEYYDSNGDGSGSLTGVEIMQPDGTVNFNYDDKGTKKTVTKPILTLISTQTWTNWTLNGSNWNEIGSKPKPYGGSENLNLVANYATLANVTLFDDKDYAIGTVTSNNAGFTGDDSESHYHMLLAQDAAYANDVWVITPKAGVTYDYVTVTLYKTNNKDDYYSIPVSFDGTKYTATLNFKTYRTGIYRAEIAAYSPVRPNDPYTAQVGVVIVDTPPAGVTPAAPVYAVSAAATLASAGDPATLTVTDPTITKTVNGAPDASYAPSFTYAWEKSTDSTDGINGTWTTVAGQTASTLTTNTAADNGWYRCTVTDGAGSSKSSTTTGVQVTNS